MYRRSRSRKEKSTANGNFFRGEGVGPASDEEGRGNQVEPGKRREEERGNSVKCKEFVSHLRTEAKIRSFAGFLIRPVCDYKELDLGNIFNEILNH